MSVGLSGNCVNYQPINADNKENTQSAKADGWGGGKIAKVALGVFWGLGFAVAGITLTALGCVTPNPMFLNIGIALIFASVTSVIHVIYHCVKD